MKNRKLHLLLAGLALGVLEVFVIQERTLFFPDQTRDLAIFAQTALRLLWDVSVYGILVLTLHRNLLALVFVMQFIFFNIVVLYHDYFRHPLSLVDGLRNVTESMFVAPHGVSIIDPRVVAVLFVLLLTKLSLVGGAGEKASERGLVPIVRRRWVGRALATAAVCLTLGLATAPSTKNQSLVSRYGPALGYIVPTAFDATLPYSDRLLARAIDAGSHPSDRLSPVEAPITIGEKFVIVQVESLDWGVVDFDIDGQAVAPFLRRLRDRSLFYKLEAVHIHGSADADFVAMMGRLPSPDTIAYYVDGYPYNEALPHLLRANGYDSTTFVHGVTGSFFSRRNAFSQMGFSSLIFEEELRENFGFRKPEKNLGFDDEVIFDVARAELATNEGKAFAFLVTVSSHGPFTAVPPDEPLLVATPSSAAERYFNSIHYVDRVLEKFIDSLPKGSTVVIYGDHVSQVEFPGYDPGIDRRREFVPLYIHNVGEDLAKVQRTRTDELAVAGHLNFIDVSAYLRTQLRDARPLATQVP